MTKVKICGLKTLGDIEIVNKALPDYIGFVFADSKRKISKELATLMKQALDQRIQAVGVFVNAPIEQIISLCKEQIIDCIQLHGKESLDYVKELRAKVTNPIIYAKQVKMESNQAEFAQLEEYPVDYFLFDTYVKGIYGGSGKLINYQEIPILNTPFFLAGGLNITNVEDAVIATHPYCVDVSSGVEIDGIKNEEKVIEFIHRIREMKG